MRNASDEARIDDRHLRRTAIVYARQSSPAQVRSHSESTRVQRGMVARARALGWPDATLIDDDLGVSASGLAERAGFQRMLTLVATCKVGLLLCLDASRLSRNSPDWAQLFQLCGHFDTLVADLGQVYDLSIPNDRLVLGVKAVISEMELATIRLRLQEGIESKASRGELVFMLPAGYVHDHASRIVKDPDRRVREAIAHLFTQFRSATSIRQLALQYQETRTLFPVRRPQGARAIRWLVPTYAALRKTLTNPLYGGAYAWGRKRHRVEYVDGQLRKRYTRRAPIEEAKVFIPDHHEGYIPWERYRANQAKIAENRASRAVGENRGAIRKGPTLLAGLLRCGHCGRKLRVSYGTRAAMYVCEEGGTAQFKRCLSIGTRGLDLAVGEQLCRALEPDAVDAAIEAETQHERDHQHVVAEAELRVKAAKYEADRAMEQFDQVDPKNRLVADTLEGRPFGKGRCLALAGTPLLLEQSLETLDLLALSPVLALEPSLVGLEPAHPPAQPEVVLSQSRTAAPRGSRRPGRHERTQPSPRSRSRAPRTSG
jgi:DNA invertase Pin-like site-specific DNA recombinase